MTGPEEKQRALLGWLTEVAAIIRAAQPFTIDGVDVVDVLLNPLLLSLLAEEREAGGPLAALRGVRDRARLTAFRAKTLAYAATSRRSASGAQVVFAPCLKTHITTLLPIAVELAAAGEQVDVVTTSVPARDLLRDQGIEPVLLGSRGPRSFAARHAVAAAERSADLVERRAPTDPRSRRLAAVLRSWTPMAHELITSAALHFDRTKPRAVVVGNDLTIEGRAQCLVARRRGIPTWSPMHGLVDGEPLQGFHVCDEVLCWGDRSRSLLAGIATTPTRFVATGAPGFQLRRAQRDKDPRVAALLGARAELPMVLVATSGPGHSVSLPHHEKMIAAFAALAAQRPGVVVVVKLHPKDRIEHYNAAIRAGVRVIGPAEAREVPSFAAWLDGTSVVVTATSTAGADALLAGVPVIDLDLEGDLYRPDYVALGATISARSPEALLDAVDEIMGGARRDELSERMARYVAACFSHTGADAARAAAERIRDTLRATLSTGSSSSRAA